MSRKDRGREVLVIWVLLGGSEQVSLVLLRQYIDSVRPPGVK